MLLNGTLHADKNLEPIKEEGLRYIKLLGGTLKKEVQEKMKEDVNGTLAMGFCSTRAQEITEDVNAKLPDYASVRRTALRVRNEANKPDEADVKVMQVYEKAIADKKFDPKDIAVLETEDAYRVYKPLITKKMCLTCHGDQISDDIQAVIKKVYPNDKAIGFKEGDLRGVIVAEIKKD
jgi:hypothetical protein